MLKRNLCQEIRIDATQTTRIFIYVEKFFWPKIKQNKNYASDLLGKLTASWKAKRQLREVKEIVEMILLINLHNDLWAIQKIWFETFLRLLSVARWVQERSLIHITFFMDLIINISTYSMLNWLCNDLTEMADQLKYFHSFSCSWLRCKNICFSINIFSVYCTHLSICCEI